MLNRENGNIKGINAPIYLFIFLFNNNYKQVILTMAERKGYFE